MICSRIMTDALYARQSIDKSDSISIESQLDFCRYETRGEEFVEYIDRGYSGKNTNRPAFEKMLGDIKLGRISKVIVYKLDRISRSVSDFANLMDVFSKYGVEFVSSTEHFDTSTPIGRAMLNICIVFAQLERETIQTRISDAYRMRARRGFYMGGRVPYGFSIKSTSIDGITTSEYEPVAEEADQIRLIFSLYLSHKLSLSKIVEYFVENGIEHKRSGHWSTSLIGEILRNPIYVRSDASIYDYFFTRGANVASPPSAFDGKHACFLYRIGTSVKSGLPYDGVDIVVARHEGFVSSQEWLECRAASVRHENRSMPRGRSASWLSGIVRCANCGHSLSVVTSNTRWHRYFVCPRAERSKKSECIGVGGTIYVDVLENYISDMIAEMLGRYTSLRALDRQNSGPLINEKRIAILENRKTIDSLIGKLTDCDDGTNDHIRRRINELSKDITRLTKSISAHTQDDTRDIISDHTAKWKNASFELKKAVANILLKDISAADGRMVITLNGT